MGKDVPPSGEEWRISTSLPDYEVSSLGRVRRVGSQIIRATVIDHKGYPRVNVRRMRYKVHRLVAEAFYGPCPDGLECAHLNGDRTDARASNLAWVTRSENTKHSIAHGTYKRPQPPSGERHPHAKLKRRQVRRIRELSAEGGSRRTVAAKFGISPTQVHRIVHGEKWNG